MNALQAKVTVNGSVATGGQICLSEAIDARAEAAIAAHSASDAKTAWEAAQALATATPTDATLANNAAAAKAKYEQLTLEKETKSQAADSLKHSYQVMVDLQTFFSIKNFNLHTAGFEDATSELSKSIAQVEQSLADLEGAVRAAHTVVQIARIADQMAAIAAGLASKL